MRTKPLFPRQHNSPKRKGGDERVPGRKARGSPNRGTMLQMPGIFISLKRQEETNQQYFFPSLYKFKRRFLLKCCVAMTPGFT